MMNVPVMHILNEHRLAFRNAKNVQSKAHSPHKAEKEPEDEMLQGRIVSAPSINTLDDIANQ